MARKVRALVPLLLNWFGRHARDLPWRRTRDPYAIWVSEIMLQQTQVRTVVPYWQRWMRELPTLEALAQASPARIHKLWEGLGYYTRVRNLHRAARLILTRHDGQFPRDFPDVLALPGVGRYTAGAVCSIAFHQPTPVLDGNVIRILTRLFGLAGDPRGNKTRALLWQLAEQLVRKAATAESRTRPRAPRFEDQNAAGRGSGKTDRGQACSHLNQSLMELGASICTPRHPACRACPVALHCVAWREGRVAELPRIGKRPAATRHAYAAFVVERTGRFLIRQRPAGVLNGQLWEFPNGELAKGSPDVAGVARMVLGAPPSHLTHLLTVKHSITRHRIALHVYAVQMRADRRPARESFRWATLEEMDRLAFPSAHAQIRERLRRTRGQPDCPGGAVTPQPRS